MKISSRDAPRPPPLRTRPKTTPLLVILSLLCLAAPAAFVRAQQDDDEVVRVNSDLVVLNVTVTDGSGEYVHKLSYKDFKVLEDGVEQRVSLFSVEETR